MWTRAVFHCILLSCWLASTAVFAKIKKIQKILYFLEAKGENIFPDPFHFFLSLTVQLSVKV